MFICTEWSTSIWTPYVQKDAVNNTDNTKQFVTQHVQALRNDVDKVSAWMEDILNISNTH